nr:Ig-like domain-containing protein [Cohnella sp. GbtcB17]
MKILMAGALAFGWLVGYPLTASAAEPDTTIVTAPPVLSNSTTATFTFSSSAPGASFECNLDASVFTGCTTPVSIIGLADGNHTFAVRAVDGMDVDQSPAFYAWTVDTVPPSAPVMVTPANGSVMNNTFPTYSGTAEANMSVTVVVDGASSVPMTADASGNWSYTSALPLAEGPHSVLARASDGAGNTSPDSNTNTFTVDTTAPPAPVVTSPANGSTTNDTTPTYSGTAEANSIVTVVVNGSSIGTTPANASGNWSMTQSTLLTDSSHTVRARASDGAGNTSVYSNTNTFAVDTTAPPAPVVTSPANGSTTNDSTPTYSGTAEASVSVAVVVDGVTLGPVTADASGNWTYTSAGPLSDGPHSVLARASDGVGNTSLNSNTNTFTVDTTAPAAPVTVSPANGSKTNNARPIFSGTGAPNVEITVFVDMAGIGNVNADAAGNWSYTPAGNIVDGAHTVWSQAKDAIGNWSPNSNTNAFIVDTVAPPAPVTTSPADGSTTNDSTPTFTGTAEANSTVDVVVDGTSIGTTPADASGNWSLAQPTPLTDSSHTVLARASDGSGNTSPDSNTNTFTVDTTAPLAPVVTIPANGWITDDSTPTYSGTAEVNSTVTVLVDGAASGTTTANGSGAWSLTQPTPLADGSHNVSAKAADAVGNVGASAVIVTFTVNTAVTPPPPPPAVYQPSPRLEQLTARSTKDDSELALTPSFNREQFAYSAETESAEATLRAVSYIAGSSLLLDGAAWSGDSVVKLNEGSNVFTIRVASPGGAQDYVLTLVRKRAVAECPFVDLEGHWSKKYVCEAYSRSIVNGTDASHFTPDRAVTRAEFAVMLMNAIGAGAQQDTEPAAAITYSDDGELPDWAAKLVREGTAAGVLKGYPDGSFRPAAHISRAEMALMLARAAKWQTEEGATSFKDDAKLPYWARPAIGAAASSGILLGRDSGSFDPEAPATRAEAATALLRLVQSLQK